MAPGAANSTGNGTGASPDAANPARPRRWPKLLKRAAFALSALLTILLVAFFLLPVWISNEQGRTYVLQQINTRMQAKLAVADWSLGWFRGTELKNVTLTLPDGTVMLSCPQVNSDLTLWGILWGNYDVGTTKAPTVEIKLTQYPAGRTSLDTLCPEGKDANPTLTHIFRTLRGSLQITSAVVTLTSAATSQSVTYSEVNAEATIASPVAPFHIQITAVGSAGAAAAERALSYNATLPPLANWPAEPWALLADTEFQAINIPTALLCAWTRQDPRWTDSLGPNLERLRFSNHEAPPLEASRPILEIRGTDGAYLDARLLLTRPTAIQPALLTLPPTTDDNYGLSASLRISPPFAHLLRRINPVLGGLQKGDGSIHLTLSELNLPLQNPQSLQAAGTLTFPPLQLARAGLLDQLLQIGRDPEANSPLVPATIEPLHWRISHGLLAYDNFSLNCGRRQRLTFNGSIALNGTVNLMATVPAAAGGSNSSETLSSSTADVPLTGTLDHLQLLLPR